MFAVGQSAATRSIAASRAAAKDERGDRVRRAGHVHPARCGGPAAAGARHELRRVCRGLEASSAGRAAATASRGSRSKSSASTAQRACDNAELEAEVVVRSIAGGPLKVPLGMARGDPAGRAADRGRGRGRRRQRDRKIVRQLRRRGWRICGVDRRARRRETQVTLKMLRPLAARWQPDECRVESAASAGEPTDARRCRTRVSKRRASDGVVAIEAVASQKGHATRGRWSARRLSLELDHGEERAARIGDRDQCHRSDWRSRSMVTACDPMQC